MVDEESGQIAGPSDPTPAGKPLAPEKPSTPSVLIVDDVEINRVVMRQYLKGTSYNVDEAENGAVAVEKVKARRYDFIIMDLLMPEMDGFESMRAIREWEDAQGCERACIIVTLTAWPLKEAELESLMCGADAHLTRPIGREKLLDVLNTQQPRVGYRNRY
jgi:CheY-like chemotaxis protein